MSNLNQSPAPLGKVASLHLHPQTAGGPLQSVEVIEVREAQGIVGDTRYFARLSHTSGQASRRQITLIEREQIADHAAAFGLTAIAPGILRSNIETTGINLIAHLGHELQIGEAVLRLYAPRDPCAKMDVIHPGLRERMMNQRQGVLAEVLQSGQIRVGDPIQVRVSA